MKNIIYLIHKSGFKGYKRLFDVGRDLSFSRLGDAAFALCEGGVAALGS